MINEQGTLSARTASRAGTPPGFYTGTNSRLFLSPQEAEAIRAARHTAPLNRFYRQLMSRTARRAESPGLMDAGATVLWWHAAAEFLTDAAMAHALQPQAAVAAWLRASALSVVRRPEKDWVGPSFRQSPEPMEEPKGHLETAHLALAVAVVFDLARDVFTDDEAEEIREVLRSRAIPMCRRWIAQCRHLANWRCILTMGLAVPAAVLNDEEALEEARREFAVNLQVFQPDGSYGESLQYGHYAAQALMLTWEALVRRKPEWERELSFDPYARYVRWAAASLFYRKPLSGWGASPLPRSANFNDSAAILRPGADFLLHVASRAKRALPAEAGLARWLFDRLYPEGPGRETLDRSTFGFVNHFGFLSLPLLPAATTPLSPAEAEIPAAARFSCGDVILRDRWGGRTILAVRGAGDLLHGPGHLHQDLNSAILVHNDERLLVDPGHSCYRNLIHHLDLSSTVHNTCSITLDGVALEQKTMGKRRFLDGVLQAPADRGGKALITMRAGEVAVTASDVAGAYGSNVLKEFSRFWIMCGSHVIFVVDRIRASRAVRVTWNWHLNNRDDALELEIKSSRHLVARRGNAGMQLHHLGGGFISGPYHAHVHDAYHPLPNQQGEGRSGSGQLMRWAEAAANEERVGVHAIALDDYGAVDGWRFIEDDTVLTLEHPDQGLAWSLEAESAPLAFTIRRGRETRHWRLEATDNGKWTLREMAE